MLRDDWLAMDTEKQFQAYATAKRHVQNLEDDKRKLSEIVALTKQMLAVQKAYFAHRKPSDLNAAKDLERRVKKAIEAWGEGPGLFD
jgi:hypothetical protein